MIPKTTQPLTKMIRTLEGQIVVAANIALVAIPIITDSLSANQAVRYGVILNGATVIARSALKAIAAIKTPEQQPATPAVQGGSYEPVSALAPDPVEG